VLVSVTGPVPIGLDRVTIVRPYREPKTLAEVEQGCNRGLD
jgi:hypothetical protein